MTQVARTQHELHLLMDIELAFIQLLMPYLAAAQQLAQERLLVFRQRG